MDNLSLYISLASALLLALWNMFLNSRIKKIEAENQKKVETHKVQFLKEFEIYSALWDSMIPLRESIRSLRPMLDNQPADKTPDQIDRERMELAVKNANNCIDIFERQKPFYAQTIYNKLHDLSRLVKIEIIEVQYKESGDREYWKKGQENMEKVIDIMDEICELIRERIGTKQ